MATTVVMPSSTIRLYQKIPLTNDYEHTVYLKGKRDMEQQLSAVPNSLLMTIDGCKPVRDQEGVIRVMRFAGDIINATYMSWDNGTLNSRIYYGFITEIKFVNFNECEIHYEVDVMATWLPLCNMLPCYIIRQHSKTDIPGENLQPEPVDTGIMRSNVMLKTDFFNLDNRGLIITYKPTTIDMEVTGGIASGLRTIIYSQNATGLNALTELLQEISDQARDDAVISITAGSKVFETTGYSYKPITVHKSVRNKLYYKENGDFKPKNMKLLTYPYTWCRVSSPSSKAMNIRWEDNTLVGGVQFNFTGTYTTNVEVICRPDTILDNRDNESSLNCTLSGFPQYAWTTDTYRAWLAQTASAREWELQSAGISAVSSGISSLFSLNLGGVFDAGFSYYNTLKQQEIAKDQAGMNPTAAHGVTTVGAAYAMENMEFYIENIFLEPTVAQSIDHFFTRFGYAQNALLVPNFSAREHFTYVKCSDVNFEGNIPSEARKKITSILLKGITFWNKMEEVGDFNVDNTVPWEPGN